MILYKAILYFDLELEKHMRYNPKKHRFPVCNTTGILLIDKPKDWTSFDVVNFVRANFNIPKVGHCGTLDPAATGLLVLVLGKFTTLSSRLAGEDKVYQATVRLGTATDSGDLEGAVIEEKDPSYITEEQLKEAILSFKTSSILTSNKRFDPPCKSNPKLIGCHHLGRASLFVTMFGMAKNTPTKQMAKIVSTLDLDNLYIFSQYLKKLFFRFFV